ncbi:MAG: redoxin domain-containing protein [Cryomorphaceae bacterium]
MKAPLSFRVLRFSILLFAAIHVSCGSAGDRKIESAREPVEAIETSDFLSGKKGAVLLFTAPECPLCLNYAPAIAEFADRMKEADIAVVSVVSGTYYSLRESEKFLTDHDIKMELLIDTANVLSRKYGATITPEAVLTDSVGKAMYRGAIDNWAISLGRKRLKPTEHYLSDAVENYLAGRKIDPKTTDAVGCFIE